jgi:predicted nucleic acid-binding protein
MTTADDILFVDTNVLLTATDESRLLHSEALNLLSGITNRNKRPAANGQVIREYLVVATRPIENNGRDFAPFRDIAIIGIPDIAS